MKNEITKEWTNLFKKLFLISVCFAILISYNIGNILSATRSTKMCVKHIEAKYSSRTDHNCINECKEIKYSSKKKNVGLILIPVHIHQAAVLLTKEANHSIQLYIM